jgi:hypothetical protein
MLRDVKTLTIAPTIHARMGDSVLISGEIQMSHQAPNHKSFDVIAVSLFQPNIGMVTCVRKTLTSALKIRITAIFILPVPTLPVLFRAVENSSGRVRAMM